MNSTTAILIALTLALLLVAAFYGLSEAVIDTSGEAIDNFSDVTEDDEGNVQFSSVEPYADQEVNVVDTTRRVIV